MEHGGNVDCTAEVSTDAWPDGCTVLHADPKLWWTGAVNAGLSEAFRDGADDVLLVNDDQEFDEHILNVLRGSRSAMDELIGAKVLELDHPSRIVAFGGSVDFWTGQVTLSAAGSHDGPQYEVKVPTTWLPTQGILLSRELWKKVGRLRVDLFPHYMGDVHLSMRVHEVGGSVSVCGAARSYVDSTATGMMRSDVPLSLHRGLRALFSRRSWANIRDHAHLARAHGPRGCMLPYLRGHLGRHSRRTFRQGMLLDYAFDRAEALVRKAYDSGREVALYGSGWDTQWLLDKRPSLIPSICFLIDEQRAGEASAAGLDVLSNADALARGVTTVVINSSAHEEAMWQVTEPLREAGVEVHRLYSGLLSSKLS